MKFLLDPVVATDPILPVMTKATMSTAMTGHTPTTPTEHEDRSGWLATGAGRMGSATQRAAMRLLAVCAGRA